MRWNRVRRQIDRAHQVKRLMGGTLSNCNISIEAHFDMDWKRGHTVRCIVEDEDDETATPKHTEEMQPKITEETIWWIIYLVT